MGQIYLKALTARRSTPFDGEIPRIEAHLERVVFDESTIRYYNELCGFTGDLVPWTYPQVIAAPIHGQIMANDAFPLPLMGLIHVEQDITVHRPIEIGTALSVLSWVEGHHEAKSGVEFDLHTEFRDGDELVWKGVTKVLHRRKGGGSSKSKRKPNVPGNPEGSVLSTIVRVPEDMGRRYATIGRDYNPIHLYPLTAKAFGFKRAIVHGMWTLARALAELDDFVEETGTLHSKFVRPVFLPSTINIYAVDDDSVLSFGVRSGDGRTTHVVGSVGSL